MISLKCKMCGGSLELIPDENICECEFCGTRQTVPTADNDKKITLFDRANRLRMKSEFDKAASVYESIVTEFPEEAEAYWGLCLCKYGIEYVDDPATGKKVPTCHRTSFEGIFKDTNFELAQEYSDGITRSMYREEAKEIDRLQKTILEIAQKEDPFDIFICYKETDENGNRTKDSVRAQEIYNELTKEGYKVFFSRITLEDKLGEAYEPYIFSALNSSKIMLAIGTSYDNYNAVWVKNEWSRFLQMMKEDSSKKLIPCYSDIDAYDMPEEFSNLQGQDMAKIGFLQDLLRGIGKILNSEGGDRDKKTSEIVPNHVNSIEPLLKRVFMFLEDGAFDDANQYCERVLDQDPENAQAYLGKLLAELKVRTQEDLKNYAEPFDDRNNYRKVIRFGDDKLVEEMAAYNQAIRVNNENKRIDSIYQAALSNMQARSERAYNKAIELFQSIQYYKDSKALVSVCEQKIIELRENAEKKRLEAERLIQEKKEKAEAERLAAIKKAEAKRIEEEKKVDAVIQTLEEYWLQGKGTSLQDQLKAQEQKLVELKHLREELPSLLEELAENERMIDNAEKTIHELRTKRPSLGLFARKEKQAIDVALNKTVLEKEQMMRKTEEIKKKLQGSGNTVEVDQLIQKYSDHIVKIQEELNDTQNQSDTHMSCEEALQYLSNPAFRELVLKRDLDNIIRINIALAGDTISFGDYHGTIEWLVLERNQNKLLLISKYGLEVMPFYDGSFILENLSWKNCSLRTWLNNTFLNTAFSSEERKHILPVNNDMIFLLGLNEAKKYFQSDEARKCAPTDYARSKGASVWDDEKTTDGKPAGMWWLQTMKDAYSDSVRYVDVNGKIYAIIPSRNDIIVRPVMWVDV